jgi:hypothetical protein
MFYPFGQIRGLIGTRFIVTASAGTPDSSVLANTDDHPINPRPLITYELMEVARWNKLETNVGQVTG